jgi:spore germination protein GerM
MSKEKVAIITIIAAGLWIRTLPPGVGPLPASWRSRTTMVTLYFADGPHLFPVTRSMLVSDDLPRAALQALFTGPAESTGLTSPIPPGVETRSVEVVDGIARVNLSSAFLAGPVDTLTAEAAVVQTLTALAGIASVELNVEGKRLLEPTGRTPLLYYVSARGLVALPAAVADPREALDRLLSHDPDPGLTRFPDDLRVLRYEHDPEGSLSLGFSYTPAVRALAMTRPETMRLLLVGLIATLTEFPHVRTVRVDFEGRSVLGLGHCSDLLNAPQPRPRLLNDERLLQRWGRASGTRAHARTL